MPRKLKTFITNIGFFELAIAAPSMKAALEAWGMNHNAFHNGFAKETLDPKIIAASQAKPGVVLKRGVGTTGAFTEDAELPKFLPSLKPPKLEPRKKQPKSVPKSKPVRKDGRTDKRDRAAILSFEKERRQRERQRQMEDEREAARNEEKQSRIRRAVANLDDEIEKARERHDRILGKIQAEQESLERQADIETKRWGDELGKLKSARKKAER